VTDETIVLLERFERDVLAAVQKSDYAQSPNVVLLGLLATLALFMGNGVAKEPESLPMLLDQIDRLRAHVTAAAARGPAPDRRH
jgi:hypothetical protein